MKRLRYSKSALSKTNYSIFCYCFYSTYKKWVLVQWNKQSGYLENSVTFYKKETNENILLQANSLNLLIEKTCHVMVLDLQPCAFVWNHNYWCPSQLVNPIIKNSVIEICMTECETGKLFSPKGWTKRHPRLLGSYPRLSCTR